ncbi:hypothetical protein AcV5_005433 [Taiwanofungus camphoratus]|nr:hypothetical protein AcV5_005433 [Antrodia cinnamomea]
MVLDRGQAGHAPNKTCTSVEASRHRPESDHKQVNAKPATVSRGVARSASPERQIPPLEPSMLARTYLFLAFAPALPSGSEDPHSPGGAALVSTQQKKRSGRAERVLECQRGAGRKNRRHGEANENRWDDWCRWKARYGVERRNGQDAVGYGKTA